MVIKTYLVTIEMKNRVKYATTRILENKKLSKTIYLIKTKLLDEIPEPQPPQFVMLWIPGYEAIPMSIAYYNEKEMWFIVKPIGLTTNALSKIREGEYIGLIGPLGKPLLPLNGENYLFIAGGSGLAPVIYYLQKISSKSSKLIYGTWSFDEIGEIPELVRKMNCIISTTCLDNKCDYYGLVTDYIKQEDIDKYDYIIACGPIDMLKNLIRVIDRKYWCRTIVILESMIKCGIGLCGSCRVFPGKQNYLCIDGPGYYLSNIGDYF